MKIIRSQRELANLAQLLDVRDDWHEPQEHGLSADTFGRKFDNSGAWPFPRRRMDMSEPPERHPLHDPERATERYVVLYRTEDDVTEPEPIAAVNLADLFAWAAEIR